MLNKQVKLAGLMVAIAKLGTARPRKLEGLCINQPTVCHLCLNMYIEVTMCELQRFVG